MMTEDNGWAWGNSGGEGRAVWRRRGLGRTRRRSAVWLGRGLGAAWAVSGQPLARVRREGLLPVACLVGRRRYRV